MGDIGFLDCAVGGEELRYDDKNLEQIQSERPKHLETPGPELFPHYRYKWTSTSHTQIQLSLNPPGVCNSLFLDKQ